MVKNERKFCGLRCPDLRRRLILIITWKLKVVKSSGWRVLTKIWCFDLPTKTEIDLKPFGKLNGVLLKVEWMTNRWWSVLQTSTGWWLTPFALSGRWDLLKSNLSKYHLVCQWKQQAKPRMFGNLPSISCAFILIFQEFWKNSWNSQVWPTLLKLWEKG